jgi:hypothetical protein
MDICSRICNKASGTVSGNSTVLNLSKSLIRPISAEEIPDSPAIAPTISLGETWCLRPTPK